MIDDDLYKVIKDLNISKIRDKNYELVSDD